MRDFSAYDDVVITVECNPFVHICKRFNSKTVFLLRDVQCVDLVVLSIQKQKNVVLISLRYVTGTENLFSWYLGQGLGCVLYAGATYTQVNTVHKIYEFLYQIDALE